MTSFWLARDYLERAQSVLDAAGDRGQKVRTVIEEAIELIHELECPGRPVSSNVLDLCEFRSRSSEARR